MAEEDLDFHLGLIVVSADCNLPANEKIKTGLKTVAFNKQFEASF